MQSHLREDDDDVDLFVSPRRFVGSTPSAKKAKERAARNAFKDEEAPRAPKAHKSISEDASYQIDTDIECECFRSRLYLTTAPC